jgi:hypothetical protein
MTRFLNYDTKDKGQKNLWRIMTREGAKRAQKTPLKTARFFL